MTMWRGMGLQIIGGSDVILGKPKVVKLVDPSVEFVREIRGKVGPDRLIVVRWRLAWQPLDAPTQRGTLWVAQHAARMAAMAQYGPIAFEGYNEIADEQAEAYCSFEVARLREMRALGFPAVVGNFSVGTPREDVWPLYQPMLDAMRAGDCLGLHEYWTDARDILNPWHVCRFALPDVAPYLKGIPIIITECGRDRIEDHGMPESRWGYPGWKADPNLMASQYMAELRQVGAKYATYTDVVGACVFTVGNDSRWANYDVREIWPYVVQLYDAEPVEPEPEPTGAWAVKSQLEDEFDGERWRFTVEKWEAHHDEPDGDCSVRV